MRTAKLLFLITLLASLGYGQAKPAKGIDVAYDKFKDETTVSFVDFPSTFMFTHPGRTIDADAQEFFFRFGYSCPGYFCFRGDVGFRVIIDGGPPLQVAEDEHLVLADTMVFIINRENLAKLAAATKQVEYQVGTYRGTWKDKIITKFKALLDAGTVKK